MYLFLCCVADWALPSKQIKEVFSSLAFEKRTCLPVIQKYCAFKTIDVDTEEAEEYLHKYNVTSVPEVLLIKVNLSFLYLFFFLALHGAQRTTKLFFGGASE